MASTPNTFRWPPASSRKLSVNGNINYLSSISAGISAAVAGLPLVVVISFCDTSPWVLVTQKDINQPRDLVGKTVALSGVRTSPYYFFQAFLKKYEINDKELSTINTGGTADSFRALTSNRVAATVLTPPFDDKAVSLGYKKFMQLGELADIPYVGLVTSQNEIKNNRESVRRTVAAVYGIPGLAARQSSREHEDDRRQVQGQPDGSGKYSQYAH